MKKAVFCMMLWAVLAGLTACGAKGPAAAADGAAWDDAWIMLGAKIGAEAPGDDFTLRDVKGAKNMTYTAWSVGEARSHTDAQGEESDVYDAQLVVLAVEAGTAEAAQANVDEWLSLAGETYSITSTTQQTCNGQEFTVLTYTFSSDTSPFSHGVSAFTTFHNWAISVEFACQDTFEEDAWEIVKDFLEHCHYAADEWAVKQ